MSANRKEPRKEQRNVSFQPTHSVSVRSHRHQTSDSGVGSDHDSYGSSPDRSQDYSYLYKTHTQLKDEHAKLNESYLALQEELRDMKARFTAVQNSVEVLENDKATLVLERRHLREELEVLRAENRKSRTTQPQDTKMTGALPPQSASSKTSSKDSKSKRRSESKVRKSSSDEEREHRHKEDKEREKRHKEDKERLGRRFDHKDDDNSVSSNSSSGRSRRESYVEPYGPSAGRPAPSVVETVQRSRSKRESTYSQRRPQVFATTTMTEPVYSGLPRTPTHPDYESAVYDDGADGNYRPYPLPADTYRRY